MDTFNSSNFSILFLGYGYVAQYFTAFNSNMSFTASFHKSKPKYFGEPQNVTHVPFDDITPEILDKHTNFVLSIPPFYERQTDAVLEKFGEYFANRKEDFQLIYLSATSVYGDHGGGLVAEDAELKAASNNGFARIECEKEYLKFGSTVTILRIAGIYGPVRNPIEYMLSGKLSHNTNSSKVTSRIHVHDICGIIKDCIKRNLSGIYNLADTHPCPSSEVHNYVCENILDIPVLPVSSSKPAYKNTSFALDNKIVDSSKVRSFYSFAFPSYRDGLSFQWQVMEATFGSD